MSRLPWLSKQNNKDEIVRALQNGADINEQNKYGQTALYLACQNNYAEITGILLKNEKVNVNLQSEGGYSPFYAACNCSFDGYTSALLMIQDARVDINMADNYGWSPLMYACYDGYTKIVRLLLSYGRNIDIRKKSTEDSYSGDIASGSTVLDIVKQRNYTDVVQLLQQYQNNPTETQKTLRNKLNLKGKK